MAPEMPQDILFEQVWRNVSNVIDNYCGDGEPGLFLKALLMGGTVAAEYATVNCNGLSGYWNGGDEVKAHGLAKLFFWMIFSYNQYQLYADKNISRDELITVKEAAERLLPVFGDMTEEEVDLFINFNTQLNHDIGKDPHLVHLSSLLLAVSSEICGHKCLDWSKVQFPVIEMVDIASKGAIIDSKPINNKHDISEMQTAFLSGIKAANVCYEKV